jgi:hypothetical protein
MLITIHQPDFLPWLGFFDRWSRADLYLILDDVQFLRRGWHNRDRIKTAGGPQWLTVPVRKGKQDQLINEVMIDNDSDWRRKHLAAVRHAYAKAPGFDHVFPALEAVYGREHDRLIDLNLDLLEMCRGFLGITTPTALASDTPVHAASSQRLLELVLRHHGDAYLTGTGSRDYLDESLFLESGVSVQWQKYEPAPYPQLNGPFEAKLSVLDALMNNDSLAGR